MDITSIAILVLLSILCVLMMAMTTICIALVVKLIPTITTGTQQPAAPSVDPDGEMQKRLERQLANIMAYNGTGTNQNSIDKDGDGA